MALTRGVTRHPATFTRMKTWAQLSLSRLSMAGGRPRCPRPARAQLTRPHGLTHSLNLLLWILGPLAPSGVREQVAASFWTSAPSDSSDWLTTAGGELTGACVPHGAAEKGHGTALWGGQTHPAARALLSPAVGSSDRMAWENRKNPQLCPAWRCLPDPDLIIYCGKIFIKLII